MLSCYFACSYVHRQDEIVGVGDVHLLFPRRDNRHATTMYHPGRDFISCETKTEHFCPLVLPMSAHGKQARCERRFYILRVIMHRRVSNPQKMWLVGYYFSKLKCPWVELEAQYRISLCITYLCLRRNPREIMRIERCTPSRSETRFGSR